MYKTILQICIGLILTIGLYINSPFDVNAYSAGPVSGTLGISCSWDPAECGGEVGDLKIHNYVGQVYISVYSRPFNFTRSDNGGNLVQNDWVPIGTNLTFSPSGSASGSWFVTGGATDSPDLGAAGFYTLVQANQRTTGGARMRVGAPATRDPISVDGGGAVSCNGWNCRANSVGTASITVTFPGGNVIAYSNSDAGVLRSDQKPISYGAQSFTYNFNVYEPDRPPTISNITVNNISYTTANVNWRYSDPDGDAQTWWNVQVATDSGFSNIVLWNGDYGTITNSNITNLRPNTTYYTRVQGGNAKAGTGWVNGPAFTTLANNPPNLGEFSCSSVPTGYTTASTNWNYTGSDPDGLVLRMRYKRPTDALWTTVNLPGNRTGTQTIANLISGFGYNVEISVTDIYNTYLTDRWKGCGTVTPTEYPIPTVNFNLSSGTNTASSGGTLTISTGDPISTNWTITNTAGLQDNRCVLSTTGVRTIFNENNLGFGPDSRQNNNVAIDPVDRTYTINLSCPGKPAQNVRSVNSNITLVILSRPVISCTVKNTVVASESPLVGITGSVINGTAPYTWSVSKDGQAGPYTILSGITGATFDSNIDYTGVGLGKYTPWLRVVDRNNRTASKACDKGITNLGDRSIREIAP